ncbi:hybrid sensor histidine kinase/response regulator [Pseudoalteromonas sp. GB56]
MLSRLLFLCLFWVCNVQGIEQLTPYATHWDSTKGLTHNSVYDIEKDAFGRLWLAGPGGVSIVDGLGVVQLKKSAQKGQGIRFNPVTQIHARDQYVWLLGLGGIELVDPRSLKASPFPDPNGILQRVTNMLFIDDSLAYVISNRQLVRLELSHKTARVVSSELYEGVQVNSFARYDQAHILLMTTNGLVLYNWQSGKHRLFNLENLARGKEDIRALTVDLTNQNVWISIFNKGIYVYDKQNRLKTHLSEQTNTLPSNMISSLEVKAEHIYAVTQRGMVILDSASAMPMQHILPTSVNDSYRQASMALSAHIGANKELFIGTTNGFYHISPLAYEFQSLGEHVAEFTPPILTQFIDNNELVILTPNQQLRFSDTLGWRSQKSHLATPNLRYFPGHANAVKNFSEIAIFNDEYASYTLSSRPDDNAPLTYSAYIPPLDLFVLVDDKYLHIARMQEGALHTEQSYPLELASVIDTVYANGQLYLSSQRHGVMSLSLAQIGQGDDSTLRPLEGAQAVTSLFLDSLEQLWITTLDEGVYTLDTTDPLAQMAPLQLSQGGFIPSANCITEDAKQRIWISSRHGVSAYDPTTKKLHSYTGANGLGAIPATDYCGRVGQSIFFANSEDLLLVDPDSLNRHNIQSELTLTNLSIDGESSPLQDGIEIIDPSVIEFAMSTSLPPAEGDLLLYRLQGTHSKSSQWLPSRSRYVTLIKPKPGKYVIQAKVIGYDGAQKAYVESYFHVQPPFYLRPSMIAIYVTLTFIAVALGFAFKLRLKNAELAVSELKHQEQKSYAQELAQQVEAKTQLYKEQQQIAVKANLDKTRFIASASHDLRAPLNAIRLKLLDTLPAHSPNSDAILGEITLLDQLVDSIVSLSKFDANMVKPANSDVELCALITQSLQRFSDMANRKAQSLALKTDIADAWVHIDPFLLARVINNLIDNAIKNTPENGHIDVILCAADDHYTLAIKDSGTGIDEALKEKVFNSFVRGTGSYAGSGLGLTIVHHICTILQLSIQLENSSSGCTFTLTIPNNSQRQDSAVAALASRTVLIIDDDPNYANDVANMVERRGLKPEVALSSEQALAYNGPKPELIISDYHLDNGSSGSDIAEQLAERFSLSQNNIIIMSEDIRVRDQIKLNFGYRFLNKPIKYSRLSWLIQQLGDGPNNE